MTELHVRSASVATIAPSAVQWLDADGDLAPLGGKAGPLSRLAAAGLPVPPGFVILPHAFWPTAPAGFDERTPLEVSGEIQEEIREAYAALGRRLEQPAPLVAVRSSANAEDLDAASFAGQYDTFLGVRGAEEVVAFATRCWASLWSAHAVQYREQAAARIGRALPPPAMAVLVQALIPADAAGVAFTADPISGDRGSVTINAAWGLGQSVVDGEVEADTWEVGRQTRAVLRHTAGHKPTRTGIGPDAARIPVAEDLQRQPCLTADQVGQVVDLALRAEGAIGAPADVEWAIAGDALWLLQARPITTGVTTTAENTRAAAAAAAADGAAATGLTGVAGAVEGAAVSEPAPAPPAPAAGATPTPSGEGAHADGPSHVFPFRWPDEAAAGLHWRRQTFRRPLRPLQEDASLAFRQSFVHSGNVKGSEKVDRSIVLNGSVYATQVPSPFAETDRLARKAVFERPANALHERGENYLHTVIFPEVDAGNARLAAVDPFTLEPTALAAHLEEAFAWYERAWTLHWLWAPDNPKDRFVKLYQEVTGSKDADGDKEAAGGADKADDEAARSAAAELLTHEPNLLTDAVDGLIELARVAQRHTPLRDLLLSRPAADVLATLHEVGAPEAPEGAVAFRTALDALLEREGLRCGAGFGSESDEMLPSWREDPSVVVALVQRYVPQDLDALLAARHAATAERDRRVEHIRAGIADPERLRQFDFWLDAARRAQQTFEDHNYKIDSAATSLLHLAITACGRRLAAAGRLDDAADVWWLHRHEIGVALRGLVASADAEPRHHRTRLWRRRRRTGGSSLPPAGRCKRGTSPSRHPKPWVRRLRPSRTSSRAPRAAPKPAAEPAAPPEGVLATGQTGSAGTATGRVRLVDRNALVPDVQAGDVLVAHNAGPVWTPVFPTVAAVVLDEGVLFQHAMLTCREYGVPAIFRAKDATKRLQEGQRVTVDATHGWVLPAQE